MVNTTVSGNNSRTGGGGINGGEITLINSTVSGNTARQKGGGIAGGGSFTNSTVSGNTAGEKGGGIYVGDYPGTLTLTHSTVTQNRSEKDGGDVYVVSMLELTNTIIAGNSAPRKGPDCYGDPISLGHNLIGDNRDCGFIGTYGDLVGTVQGAIDPNLSPLQGGGNATLTHALLPGSPAIDAGDAAFCLLTDQRGVTRSQGGGCDIGAYEH